MDLWFHKRSILTFLQVQCRDLLSHYFENVSLLFWCHLEYEWGTGLLSGRLFICRANQWTGFYMIRASIIKELSILRTTFQTSFCRLLVNALRLNSYLAFLISFLRLFLSFFRALYRCCCRYSALMFSSFNHSPKEGRGICNLGSFLWGMFI